MNFTDNNPLSMTGEDSFTSINQILQRCVLIDTNQTILSSKIFEATTTTTFDGDVELKATTDNTGVLNNTGTLIVGGTLNLNTDIVADKPSLNFTNTGTTIINPQNIMALQIAGTDKFVTDVMNTSISADTQISLNAGTSTTTLSSNTFASNFNTGQLFSVGGNQKLQIQATNTNLNNTTTSIQSGGTTKISVGASTTALNNTTTNIQSGGTNKIVVDGTTTGMNNDTTNIQSGGTTKIQTASTTTTLTNPTITMNDGTTDRFSQTTTTTTLTNVNIALDSGGVVADKYRQTSTQSIIDNDTIRMRYRTADKLVQTATATTLSNTTMNITSSSGGTNITDNSTGDILIQSVYGDCSIIANELAYIQGGLKSTIYSGLEGEVNVLIDTQEKFNADKLATNISNTTINLQDATPTTRFAQTNGTTTITNTNIGTNGILTQTGNFTAKGTTITLQDATPTTHFLQNSSATTLTNTTINLQDATPTTRFTQTNGATTITNTAISLTGTTGALALTTTTGKASINSTTGQIELKTAGTSLTSINIENTSATTGGITMKTSGSSGISIESTSATGDIILESGDNLNLRTTNSSGDILITSSNADVDITCGSSKEIKFVVGSTTEGGINSKGTFGTSFFVGDLTTYYPVCFTIVLMQKTFNTSSLTDLDFGYRINNDSGNTCNRFMHPFPYVIVGYSVVADDDANNTTFQVFFTKYSATAQDTAVATDFQSFNSGGFTATIRSTSGSFTEAIYLSDTYRIAPTQCLGAKIDDSSATNNEKTIILHCRQRA
jgi:hypothetical protein